MFERVIELSADHGYAWNNLGFAYLLANQNDDAVDALTRAAELLQKLADELRSMGDSPAYKEYQAICGWLDEFDGMVELGDYAHDYRVRIGVDQFPANAEEYLRVLIGFAKDTFGGA